MSKRTNWTQSNLDWNIGMFQIRRMKGRDEIRPDTRNLRDSHMSRSNEMNRQEPRLSISQSPRWNFPSRQPSYINDHSSRSPGHQTHDQINIGRQASPSNLQSSRQTTNSVTWDGHQSPVNTRIDRNASPHDSRNQRNSPLYVPIWKFTFLIQKPTISK